MFSFLTNLGQLGFDENVADLGGLARSGDAGMRIFVLKGPQRLEAGGSGVCALLGVDFLSHYNGWMELS